MLNDVKQADKYRRLRLLYLSNRGPTGLVKPGFHLCLKGAWDMSKVPVTHVSTCVLSQAQ